MPRRINPLYLVEMYKRLRQCYLMCSSLWRRYKEAEFCIQMDVEIRSKEIWYFEGLLRFMKYFDCCYEAIERSYNKRSLHYDKDGECYWTLGLNFLWFEIPFFIENSLDKTNLPVPGLDDNNEGATGKEFYDIIH